MCSLLNSNCALQRHDEEDGAVFDWDELEFDALGQHLDSLV